MSSHRAKNGTRAVRWNFKSSEDVKSFWKKFQRVPARSRRTRRDEERYCLALYFLALATHRKLKYPLRVDECESPDFTITSSTGKTTALEVIKATEMWIEPTAVNGNGKPDWLGLLRGEVETRTKDLLGGRRDLLVYEDMPLPMAERPQALATLRDWLIGLKQAHPPIGKVSIITSLDVLIDTSTGFRNLPFVNWSDPDSSADFGERVTFAGDKAVVSAIRKHQSRGMPIYFTDNQERLVKRMPDGTRYEVEIEPSGDEVVIGELSRR